MRIVFMGTSEFAVPALEKLGRSSHDLKLVVTPPDRPQGRGLKTKSSPVKEAAEKHKLALAQPENVNAPDFVRVLLDLAPDLIVVASFGTFLSAPVLNVPRQGCVNIHPSLLPRHRGAAPVPHTIMNGDTITGVSIFRMVKKMDAGPLRGMVRMPIPVNVTAGQLESELARLGAALLMDVIGELERGTSVEIPQAEEQATYAPKIEKKHGEIDWQDSAINIVNRIRAFNPEPLAFSFLADPKKERALINMLEARVHPGDGSLASGQIAVHKKTDLVVGCGDGAIRIERLQPQSRKAMAAKEFINGYRLQPEARFESAVS